MWSTRTELSMLRCCQQVAEHSATGTCICFSFVLSLSSVFSLPLPYLCKFNILLVIPPRKKPIILFPQLSSTYTYLEEQHQHLVFSPCFSNRTALILLDKGWESQENISVCAHVHTHRHTGISRATITPTRAAKYTPYIDVECVKPSFDVTKATVSSVSSEQPGKRDCDLYQ